LGRRELHDLDMRPKRIARLTPVERAQLVAMISAGQAPARMLTHARILLKTDGGPDGPGWDDNPIAAALDVGKVTVWRVRKRHIEEGLEASLAHRHPKNHHPRRLDGDQEAHLIALACSEPPTGRKRWTLRLLAKRMVELEYTTGSRMRRCAARSKKRAQAVAQKAIRDLPPRRTRRSSGT
jgi:transposase